MIIDLSRQMIGAIVSTWLKHSYSAVVSLTSQVNVTNEHPAILKEGEPRLPLNSAIRSYLLSTTWALLIALAVFLILRNTMNVKRMGTPRHT